VKEHRPGTWVAYLIALLVIGSVAWWVISAILGMLFKLVLIGLVVAGAIYLVGRSGRGSIDRGRRRLGR
jgi:hypothetical protein